MTHNINTSNTLNLIPFITLFDKEGIDWKPLARKYDIPQSPMDEACWVPSVKMLGFLSAVTELTGRNLGAKAGSLFSIDQLFPDLARELNQTQSFSDAIHCLIDAMSTLTSHVVVWTQKIEQRWYLCYRSAYSSKTVGFEQTEWFRCFAFISFCQNYLGSDWQPNSVMLNLHAINSELPFGYSKDRFQINNEFGGIEIELPDDYTVITQEELELDWFTVVRRLCDTYAHLPWFNIVWFSRLIGVSTRSMQRKLAQHHSSFTQLRDESRIKVAKQLLIEDQRTPNEIAYRCGYTDLSNFNRAFKRWMGMTPSAYRREHSVIASDCLS
ncbi:helix-turn-helix domain-containing protein [Vibrio sp. FNV 38]|nr:helix-turn-helix domain-containing protein [Vibrio sp. FNV 38]